VRVMRFAVVFVRHEAEESISPPSELQWDRHAHPRLNPTRTPAERARHGPFHPCIRPLSHCGQGAARRQTNQLHIVFLLTHIDERQQDRRAAICQGPGGISLGEVGPGWMSTSANIPLAICG